MIHFIPLFISVVHKILPSTGVAASLATLFVDFFFFIFFGGAGVVVVVVVRFLTIFFTTFLIVVLFLVVCESTNVIAYQRFINKWLFVITKFHIVLTAEKHGIIIATKIGKHCSKNLVTYCSSRDLYYL
jgi:hypothetical protein